MAGQAAKKSSGQEVSSLSQKVVMNGTGRPNRWEIRLGFPQLLSLWGLFLGLTLIVFLVGFYTGRDRGQKLALEDRDVPSLRLPISEQTVTSDSTAVPVSTGAIEPAPAVGSASGVLNPFVESQIKHQNAAINLKPEANREPETKPNFDFSEAAMNVARDSAAVKPVPSEDQVPLRVLEKESISVTSSSTGRSEEQSALERPPTLAQIERDAIAKGSPTHPERDLPKADKPVPVSVKPKKIVERPKAEVKKSAPEKNTLKSGEKGWFVQLAASDTRNEASVLANKVRAKGLPATIKEARVDGVLYFRVLVGPFAARDGADLAKSRLGRGMGKGQPFVKNY